MILALIGMLALAAPDTDPDLDLDIDVMQSMIDYRMRRMTLREYTVFSPGTVRTMSSGPYWYGSPHGYYYGPGWGWSATHVVVSPGSISDEWAVFQGTRRLDVPTFLTLVGDERAPQLRGQVERSRRASRAWRGVAVLGLGALVGSALAQGAAQDYDSYRRAGLVGAAGGVTGVVGLVAASGTGSRAARLASEFDATLDPAEAYTAVRRYNTELRRELGLSSEQAAAAEK